MEYKSYMVPSYVDIFCFVVKDDGSVTVGYEIGRECATFSDFGDFIKEHCNCVTVETEDGNAEER